MNNFYFITINKTIWVFFTSSFDKHISLPIAAARIRLSFSAIANAASSTSPPRAVFTRNAPIIFQYKNNFNKLNLFLLSVQL